MVAAALPWLVQPVRRVSPPLIIGRQTSVPAPGGIRPTRQRRRLGRPQDMFVCSSRPQRRSRQFEWCCTSRRQPRSVQSCDVNAAFQVASARTPTRAAADGRGWRCSRASAHGARSANTLHRHTRAARGPPVDLQVTLGALRLIGWARPAATGQSGGAIRARHGA
jgi:hypothetical protein